MSLDLDTIITVIGAFVAVAGAATAWRQAGSSAKKNDLDTLRAIVETNQREAEDERQRNADLVARLREANDRIIDLELDRQEMHKQLNATLDKLAAMQGELGETRQANEALLARVAVLESERDGLLSRIKSLEAERERLGAEVRRLTRRSFK